MTLQPFESKFKHRTSVNKYWFSAIFMLAIICAIYIHMNKDDYGSHFPLGLILSSFGTYGLHILQRKWELTYWRNEYTKDENIRLIKSLQASLKISIIEWEDNYMYFTYGRRWWGMRYKVYLFADENLIALNVDSVADGDVGLLDFGASARTEQRILDILYDSSNKGMTGNG